MLNGCTQARKESGDLAIFPRFPPEGVHALTLGMKVFSDCCLFSFSIFISERILSLEALNFRCWVSICCIWFISWSISLLMRGGRG